MLSRFMNITYWRSRILRSRTLMSAGLAAIILVAGVLPVRADVPLPKLSLTVYGGPAMIDDTYGVEGFALAGGFRAAFIFSQRFGLEGSYGKVMGDGTRTPTHNFPVDQWSLDVIYQFRPEA